MTLATIPKLLQVMLALFFLYGSQVCPAQENPIPKDFAVSVELLTMNGSKPDLTADGVGIISYKTTDLFKRGITRVRPFDLNLKIELPTGYTLFNNLAYVVSSEAVFSGPNDITFRVPAGTAKESFENLRILVAERDNAAPEKQRWLDVTLLPSVAGEFKSYISKADFEGRLADFKTRTLHALLERDPGVLVVALKDPKAARDSFVADLQVKASAIPESVIEGREIQFSFEITNNGPDTATTVSFESQIDPLFISLSQTQGTCRYEAQNIYCNLGELAKGAKATVIFRGKCRWGFFSEGKPTQSGMFPASPMVRSPEGDPNVENNFQLLAATVEPDPNQPPVVAIVKPKDQEFFVGPDASVAIVVNAKDKDGGVSKVELFDQGISIGVGKLTAPNTYELIYRNVAFGRHWLKALVTDNQGRPQESQFADFIVNGPVQLQIIEPKPNFVMVPPHDLLPVRLTATNPKGSVKEVSVQVYQIGGGQSAQAARLVGKDEYVAEFKDLASLCFLGECHIVAVAKDNAGLETTSSTIFFKLHHAATVDLRFVKEETAYTIEDGAEFDSNSPITLSAYAEQGLEVGTVKVDFYVDGVLFATEKSELDESKRYPWRSFHTTWKPRPGTYTLAATALDSYGVVGKSTPVRVVIKERP